MRVRTPALVGLLLLPVAGLVLLLAVPSSTSIGSTTPRTSGSCSGSPASTWCSAS